MLYFSPLLFFLLLISFAMLIARRISVLVFFCVLLSLLPLFYCFFFPILVVPAPEASLGVVEVKLDPFCFFLLFLFELLDDLVLHLPRRETLPPYQERLSLKFDHFHVVFVFFCVSFFPFFLFCAFIFFFFFEWIFFFFYHYAEYVFDHPFSPYFPSVIPRAMIYPTRTRYDRLPIVYRLLL